MFVIEISKYFDMILQNQSTFFTLSDPKYTNSLPSTAIKVNIIAKNSYIDDAIQAKLNTEATK